MYTDCTTGEIKTVGSENLFILKKKDSEIISIQIDQPSELIVNQMKEVIEGKRDKLYLTRGMRDIDVSYLGNSRWQLFDEFDIYEFDMSVA